MALKEVSHYFLIYLFDLTWFLIFIFTWRISSLNQFINRNIFFTSMNGSVLYEGDLRVNKKRFCIRPAAHIQPELILVYVTWNDYIPLTNRVRGPYWKLRTKFSVYGPSTKRAGHKSKGKKRGSVYSTDQENEVSKISIISLMCV